MEIVGYITVSIFLVILVLWGIASIQWRISRKTEQEKPQRLLGTVIPELTQGLDIERRYDIFYADYDHIGQTLSGVRILGYIGSGDDESYGKLYMPSRWLVVEFPDRRRAYLQPGSIRSLHESPIESKQKDA